MTKFLSLSVEDPGPKVSGNFQLLRYYGRYSNKMRGQREKRAAERGQQPRALVGREPL